MSTFKRAGFIAVVVLSLLWFAVGLAFAADLVARQGNDSVRLTEAPCTNVQVVDHLGGEQAAKEYRAASAVFQGQSYQACWRMRGNAAYLVYEDGDQGLVPGHVLKPELDA